jgi:hypothetical protein
VGTDAKNADSTEGFTARNSNNEKALTEPKTTINARKTHRPRPTRKDFLAERQSGFEWSLLLSGSKGHYSW